MPRPLWRGSLSFGLVNVPVQLTGATRDLDLHFRQLHKKDSAPIEQRRYCSQDDVEVQWEEIGRFVMRTKEYLVLVRPRKGLLSLTTMRFHDEVRPTDGIAPGGRKPAKEKIEQAVAVIESLGTDWDPERYTDCYRERLKRVVEEKKKGKKIKAPSEPKEPTPAPDLMEALQATLERMGSSKGKGNGKGSRKKEAA